VTLPAYSSEYFAAFHGGSARSAAIVVPLVHALAPVTSVADFGCGTGAWLARWQQLGVVDIVGCDGPYVPMASLAFDPARFVAVDLAQPVWLGRRFDLVQSLEVAEHLPPAAAEAFVATLVSHAPLVLFSAAVPGQGGEHHLNEQPLEYWRALFRRHGYVAVDALRPRLVWQKQVESWYRYHCLLFADAHLERPALRPWVVPDGVPLREYARLAVRIRYRMLARVPIFVVTRIAAGLRRLSGAGAQ
jgi:SAM-dependent methyltransferase